jgi:hypothetical protein
MNKLFIEAFMAGIILIMKSIPVMGALHYRFTRRLLVVLALTIKIKKNKYYVANFLVIG